MHGWSGKKNNRRNYGYLDMDKDSKITATFDPLLLPMAFKVLDNGAFSKLYFLSRL